jgi:hypothetical protein
MSVWWAAEKRHPRATSGFGYVLVDGLDTVASDVMLLLMALQYDQATNIILRAEHECERW